ncbi:MAG TPA: PAS domain S-box protein [Nitrospirota bacterium]|nr:PAS domain S-box protein [Nitrospirota bacterium]
MSHHNTSDIPFPIVGIGASAGGLKALEAFLLSLPKVFPFAIVFIQHLSSRHKSLLPDLLAGKRPDLEIVEIKNGEPILPGRIFLCPPGSEVRVRERLFQVAPLPEGHTHYPIDEFLESMAEEAKERATAVILSGAGTDGARGIQAVRSAGGCVFVQEPETAEFPGMPLAAIDTGEVDGVFDPAGIADEILKLQKTDETAASHDAPLTPEEFETFYRLIQEKTGHRFVHYKKSVVSRRIRRRMYLVGITSVKNYLDLVAAKESEARALAYDLMIGVTSFFRDRLAWKSLNQDVVRKLTMEETDVPLRVWTPACATGEEAYSIAITLLSELARRGKRREIQVFATDVNDQALERARDGKYPASIAADMPQEHLQRYFKTSEDGQSIIVVKGVRERVIFAKQDLLTDPPFSRLDLIICRNLLIYLESEAQDKCLSLFHYALKPGGYLFLGNAESAGRNKDLFKSLGHKKCRIYQKEEAKPVRLQVAVPFAAERAQQIIAKQAESPGQQQPVIGLVQGALIDEYAPAAIAVDKNYDILYNTGPTNQYLRQPRGIPTQNLLDLLPDALANRIRSALYRTSTESKPISIRASIPAEEDKKRQVTLRISKIDENLYLVVFRRRTEAKTEPETFLPESPQAIEETAVRQLESELATTRADLQTHIEQLKSMNEELQSSNEELQAANEELETSREELQSLNEELITVNAQLQEKIEEQEETNNDLNNFLASANIPTLFLDREFKVRRFTPAMSKLIKLIPSDVGRPLIDMSQENLGPELITDAKTVLDTLMPVKKEFRLNGTWYVRSVLPYRTLDSRIEGVVITYTDVTDLKRAEEETLRLASFPRLNPNPIIEVDVAGSVTFMNPAMEKIFAEKGLTKENAAAFLPPDLPDFLRDWDRKTEVILHRDVAVQDRAFGQTIYFSPKFGVARIYAFDITERKKAEEVQGRLAAIVESAEDAIISEDMNGIIQTWNVGAERIFGYRAEEAVGRSISIIVPSGHNDETPGILTRIKQGEHIENFETSRVRKDATIIPVSLTYSAIKDAGGKTIGISKIAHDITARKKAEEQLARTNQKINDILESIQDDFYVLDRDWNFIYANRQFTAKIGKEPDDFVGNNIWKMFPKHLGTVFEENLRAAMDKRVTRRFETGGKYTSAWYRMTAFPSTEGITVLGTDVTDLKKAEVALRDSEEQFRRAIEEAPIPIIMHAEDGEVLQVSRTWCELTGYTKQDIPTLDSWLNMAYGDGAEAVRDHLRELFKGNQKTLGTDLLIRTRDGKALYWSFSASSPGALRDGRRFVVGMALDITERKHAEEEIKKHIEELKAANRELARFNRAAVDRELRMIELKKEVNECLRDAGGQQRYALDFENEQVPSPPEGEGQDEGGGTRRKTP